MNDASTDDSVEELKKYFDGGGDGGCMINIIHMSYFHGLEASHGHYPVDRPSRQDAKCLLPDPVLRIAGHIIKKIKHSGSKFNFPLLAIDSFIYFTNVLERFSLLISGAFLLFTLR